MNIASSRSARGCTLTRFGAFTLSAVSGALIWAASPWVTGRAEPWDASGPYYVAALTLTGFAAGLITARSVIVYAGIWFGQLAFMIVGRPIGPLFPLGVAFLAAFSLIALLSAAVATIVRRGIVSGSRRRLP